MNLFSAVILVASFAWAQQPSAEEKAELSVQAESKAVEAKTEAAPAEKPAVQAEPQKAVEPKAEEKAAEKAEEKSREKPVPQKQAAAANKAVAEAAFLKSLLEDKDLEVVDAAVEEALSLATRAADSPAGQEARLLAAQLLAKKEDWKAAAVAYLGFIYEYPDADAAFRAKQEYREVVEKRLSRKSREALAGLVRVPEKPSKAERLAAMLKAVVDTAGEELYEPALEEFELFQSRFPAYFEADRVQLTLADLHIKNSKYDDALYALRRLTAVFPESGLVAQAQWNAAALYADNLKKYDKAVEAFQDIVKRHPKTPMVMPSLQKTAELLEERIKDYPSAADAYEKIVRLYPRTEGGLKAMQSLAKIQRDRLKQPAEAIATFRKVAEDFTPPAAVDALKEAAAVARRTLKDFAQEAELRNLLATRFPDAAEAPEALFAVGEIYESDLKDDGKAKDAFNLVASKYPTHKLAKKAADRVASIDKRGGF
ncbi:MAG: tetratricopeptide repeat protein [Elusimicrobia bacterium]|nr:tetratricopeptide repeat protein [Elusimicrobiota bacterium]MBI5882142.1 tetratricopeptide repeat protein [Elusimicrobiota bacterium]